MRRWLRWEARSVSSSAFRFRDAPECRKGLLGTVGDSLVEQVNGNRCLLVCVVMSPSAGSGEQTGPDASQATAIRAPGTIKPDVESRPCSPQRVSSTMYLGQKQRSARSVGRDCAMWAGFRSSGRAAIKLAEALWVFWFFDFAAMGEFSVVLCGLSLLIFPGLGYGTREMGSGR